MVYTTNGLMPSEFDPTINRVCRTLAASGVSDSEISEDMHFLTELMLTIGNSDASIPMEETTWMMDLAFIGLLYHRHMPWIDEHDGHVGRPDFGAADYVATLTALSNALIEQAGVSKDTIKRTAIIATARVLPHLRLLPSGVDGGDEDALLHRQWLALSCIGALVHHHLPGTSEPPPRKE